MNDAEIHILIIAEKTPRARIIKKHIEENFLQARVDIQGNEDFRIDNNAENLVCIADLVSVQESSFRIIERIKKKLSHAKIIAMHIYRSAALIEPLYDFGIDGYLYSEPSREELSRAIMAVSGGEKYRPHFFSYS
ncbi:MAG: hypothetical protein WEA56_04155 [Balneolaceae bacterium]